jgi:hypothetical protein
MDGETPLRVWRFWRSEGAIMTTDLAATLASNGTWGLLAIAIAAVALGAMTVACVIASHRSAANRLHVEGELKREMLARGLPADDIVRVIRASRADEPEGVEIPCASEVVAEHDGEWVPAIVLKRDDSKWYVHYVGSEMDENEWLPEDRIRFPASFFDRAFAENEHEMRDPRQTDHVARYTGKPMGVNNEL